MTNDQLDQLYMELPRQNLLTKVCFNTWSLGTNINVSYCNI